MYNELMDEELKMFDAFFATLILIVIWIAVWIIVYSVMSISFGAIGSVKSM